MRYKQLAAFVFISIITSNISPYKYPENTFTVISPWSPTSETSSLREFMSQAREEEEYIMSKKVSIDTLIGDHVIGCPTAAHDIITLAQTDPKEMQRLVDIFYAYEDDFFHERINIAELLIYLKYSPIKDFLINILEDEEPGAKVWPNLNDKIWAAGRLIYMENMKGKAFLEDIIETIDQEQLRYLVEELYEEADPVRCSIETLDCLLEFADKYEKIAKITDKGKIKSMLNRLHEGEVFTWDIPPEDRWYLGRGDN